MSALNNSTSTLWDKIRSGRLTTTFAVLAALSIGMLTGAVFTGRVHGAEQQKVDSSDARPLAIPSPVQLSNAFSQIAKQVGPAVVNINTESTPKQSTNRRGRRAQPQTPGGGGGGGDDDGNDMQDFLNRFFGGGGSGGGGGQAPDAGTRRALGSGFIVDPRGYIITNNHVVDKADHIYVKLSTDPDSADQGRPATVVGVDPETDIAVIKINTGSPLPTIKLGNSDGAQVGDWVLAVGSPFGLSQTVSAGIVSAKNRSIEEGAGPDNVATGQFQRFIQTDAAINPGNSGGPLVDMAGQVIGMNTAIYTSAAGSEGVGFAMPSNILINTYNMLISPEHKVTRGSIGISFQTLESSAVARVYGFANGGVQVGAITPGGPAAKAGIEPGDVILSIDGTPIKDGDALVELVSARRPGTSVKVVYARSGKRETVDVVIADRAKLYADRGSADNANTTENSDAGEGKLGITVQPTTTGTATKLGIKGGVTITSVRPGSFADEINLPQGWVITEINRVPITDDSSYRNAVAGLHSGSDVAFAMRDPSQRSSGNQYFGGTLP